MALAGVTRVGEFHYLHHDTGGAPYAEAFGEALLAAAEAGIRITLLDTCYLAGGVDDSNVDLSRGAAQRPLRGPDELAVDEFRHSVLA
jgi:hypothetical protein